jgi:hypothetical protein
VASRMVAGRRRPLPLRRWRLSGVVGDGDSGSDWLGQEVGRDQEKELSSMEELVELGEEWNGGDAERGWRRRSGEIRGQRASRPWLGLGEVD